MVLTRVKNETPYPFTFCISYQVNLNTIQEYGTINPGCEIERSQPAIYCHIYLKHGRNIDRQDCRHRPHVHRGYNAIYGYTFYIRVCGHDQSYIELSSNKGGGRPTCPNYGKQEEDRQRMERERLRRQKQQEQRRREERLERERRIEEEIRMEREALEKKLSQTNERLQAKRGRGIQAQERSHILSYHVEDDALAIQTNEIKDVEEKLNNLMTDYSIQEDEIMKSRNIAERIMVLQHRLVAEYSTIKKLPLWCLQNMDTIFGYEKLSLTENMNLLDAMMNVTLTDSAPEVLSSMQNIKEIDEIDDKTYYIMCIMNTLYQENKSLVGNLIKSIAHQFSKPNQEYLSQLLFSGIWTPTNALEFYLEVGKKVVSQDEVEKILQQVQTYHIGQKIAMSVLQEDDPMSYLEQEVQKEKDKDVTSIVEEMRYLGYSERILNILEQVLHKVIDELPHYLLKDLDESTKAECIRETRDIDLANPNLEKLVKILIALSVAVEDITTVSPKYAGEKGRGYFPRATQLASLLILLLSKTPDCEGCMLEIATGEGKSCIVALFALIQAIRGKTVDAITSSPVLARRDQEEWKKLYEMFDVTCSVVPPPDLHKCTDSQDRDRRINSAYNSQIVYGTVDNFAADILRQDFEKKTTRGSRKFDVAIVDEVDYMTLDSGVQVTFLSHEATGMRHLDQLLTAIWAKVCMCQRIEESQTGDILWATGIQYFHKLATDVVLGQGTSEHFSAKHIIKCGVEIGLISEEDLQIVKSEETDSNYKDLENQKFEKLICTFGPSQQKDLLTIFGKVLNDSVNFKFYQLQNGKANVLGSSSVLGESQTICILLMENGQACLLMSEKDLIDATVEDIASKTKYSDNYKPPDVGDDQDESVILLPRYLKEYTQNRLCVFAENALKAIVMEIDREYMIDFRYEACSHEDHCIIPIDFKSTGVLEKNKRWGDGLQQFLQMKHQLSISPLSNVTNFLSNFHFFQKYACGSGVYGVSGTLGDEADVGFLKKHYKASCYVMPTHRYTKKVELMALQVEWRDLWITEICKCVKFRICPKEWVKGQAALVICEDVKTAEELQKKLVDLGAVSSSNNITLYTRSDKHNVEMRGNFDSGEVILATNLGGRGTDFKVTDQVNHSGGLSVILTHFPANRRVEKQILGRTSRKGNPGMVQMILHKQDLSPSYQGQPIEIMRCLRENYEKQRIADMENDELLEVNMRHELFTLFCKHLAEFEKHYSPTEKEDIYCIGNVKDWFSTWTKSKKLDYQPALNALKETWALWLTLHEEDINSHKDLKLLEVDLRDVLKKRSENILQGRSENVYDFIKVAMDRTFLHIHENKNDYGALDYWMKAESTDSVYRAISLYNRAFITINQSKGDYKQEAMSLLKESKQAMNVYVSEVCNTQTFGNMIRNTNFQPHNNETNFASQIQARMSLLQSWVNYIDRSLEKLKDLQDRNKDAITKEVSVLSLSDNNNKVVTDEMSMLYDYGMSFVFEVEQKPVFCIAALLCCILGALQVLGGILICGLTCGAASQFGMGLISEGVSDMISGVQGMITGTFDWAQWAISKAISIGLSLVTAGFNLVKKAAKTIYSVAKDLLNGTRSFTSVAQDVIKSGRMVLSSATTSLTSLTSSANKDAVIQSIKGLATNATAKESMIKTAKYAGKELVKQGALEAITYGIDKAAEAAIKAIIEKLIKEEINSCVNENKDLERTLIKFIVTTAVPKSTLEAENPGNYEILLSNKEHLKQITGKACSLAVTEVLSLHETLQNVISIMENSSQFLLKILEESKVSGALVKGFQLSVSIAECAIQLTDIIKHVPTRSLINDQVIPIIISNIPDSSCYTEDSRSRFPDVIRVRQELQKIISEHASNEINDFLTNQLINLTKRAWENPYTKHCTQKLKENAEQWLKKIPMKTFSISYTNSQNLREFQKRSHLPFLVQPSPEDIDTYVRSMQDGNGPATCLELTALTKNNQLRGRGLLITLVQKDGKKLSTDHYPGTDPTAEDIWIQMQEGSLPKTIKFYLYQSDGTVHANVFEGKNALYHALAQATEQKDMSDIEQRMKNLQKEVYEEIQQNFDQYLPLMQRDLLRQSLRDMSSKYTICRDDSQMESEGKTSNIA